MGIIGRLFRRTTDQFESQRCIAQLLGWGTWQLIFGLTPV